MYFLTVWIMTMIISIFSMLGFHEIVNDGLACFLGLTLGIVFYTICFLIKKGVDK